MGFGGMGFGGMGFGGMGFGGMGGFRHMGSMGFGGIPFGYGNNNIKNEYGNNNIKNEYGYGNIKDEKKKFKKKKNKKLYTLDGYQLVDSVKSIKIWAAQKFVLLKSYGAFNVLKMENRRGFKHKNTRQDTSGNLGLIIANNITTQQKVCESNINNIYNTFGSNNNNNNNNNTNNNNTSNTSSVTNKRYVITYFLYLN